MAKNKSKRPVIFVLFRLVGFFIFLLPITSALKIGRCLGRLAFYILKKERNIALNNLDIAFGNTRSLKEKTLITREVFENLGKNFVEVMSLSKFNKDNIDKYIGCKNLGIIERLIQERKGGIALSAHLGNWELLAHYFAIKGFSVNVIARRMRLDLFERFLRRVRRRNRVNILYRDTSAKDAIALLKNNEFVGIMPDQDIETVSGVFVEFFGKLAYTANGPAVLNRLTGSPIVPCFIVRRRFGHEVLIEEPIKLAASGNRDKDILENARTYTKVIEDYVKRFPSQWVWFHDRWKTRP